MRKKVGIIKRVLCIVLIFLLSINSFAAIVSDNDGSAFITKAEFDALKSSFQSQIDSYNQSIDSKIDGAIASYLAGIKISTEEELENFTEKFDFEGMKWEDIRFSSNLSYTANEKEKMNLGCQERYWGNTFRKNNESSSTEVCDLCDDELRITWTRDIHRLDANGLADKWGKFRPYHESLIVGIWGATHTADYSTGNPEWYAFGMSDANGTASDYATYANRSFQWVKYNVFNNNTNWTRRESRYMEEWTKPDKLVIAPLSYKNTSCVDDTVNTFTITKGDYRGIGVSQKRTGRITESKNWNKTTWVDGPSESSTNFKDWCDYHMHLGDGIVYYKALNKTEMTAITKNMPYMGMIYHDIWSYWTLNDIWKWKKNCEMTYKVFNDAAGLSGNQPIKNGIPISQVPKDGTVYVTVKSNYAGHVVLYSANSGDSKWHGDCTPVGDREREYTDTDTDADRNKWKNNITNTVSANTEKTFEIKNCKKDSKVFFLFLPTDQTVEAKVELSNLHIVFDN